MQREALLTKPAVQITQMSNAREKISHITQIQLGSGTAGLAKNGRRLQQGGRVIPHDSIRSVHIQLALSDTLTPPVAEGCTEERSTMKGSVKIAKGRIEEAAGALVNNDKLRTKGQTDQAVGRVIKAGENGIRQANETARKIVERARDNARTSVEHAQKPKS